MFTSVPYRGNPLAVVADAEGLTTEEMQRFASWTNFSETTFLLEPTTEDSDYRVRIFTPDRELPFAGHPTLGSCHVWLDQGGVPRTPGVILQECGAGSVTIRSGHNSGRSTGNLTGTSPDNSAGSSRLAFAAPPLVRSGPVSAEDLAAACALVGIDPGTPGTPDTPLVDASWVANGPPWMGILLRSAEEVLALRPQAANTQDLFVGVVGPHLTGSSADDLDYEVRAFFPKHGALTEDPVTGSLNASLGQWLTAAGHATAPYTASQGAAMDRDGRVYVNQEPDGTIWVGGDVVTCIQGTVDL